MAEKTLYEELKDVLQDFKDFLDENVSLIRPAIQALAGMIPQLNELIDLLVELMGDIRTEIENLDVSAIENLDKVSSFTEKIGSFLDASSDLLPDDAEGTVTQIREVVSVVGGLPTLDQVKQEILDLIDAIVVHLNSLKA